MQRWTEAREIDTEKGVIEALEAATQRALTAVQAQHDQLDATRREAESESRALQHAFEVEIQGATERCGDQVQEREVEASRTDDAMVKAAAEAEQTLELLAVAMARQREAACIAAEGARMAGEELQEERHCRFKLEAHAATDCAEQEVSEEKLRAGCLAAECEKIWIALKEQKREAAAAAAKGCEEMEALRWKVQAAYEDAR
eukprot:TRINITY_DN10579_c0_g1_i1.p1 TRINITY_DN10579_c0_g1~~TRINITY_DN10579_c0_g1_i1.p1  ORF type:complete len:202 (-),score=64.87 TRINITY_DN10579_c0_g1_i1:203-808(-)